MARVKRIKVRFHLGRGKNYMKWKIEYPNGNILYYNPSEVQFVMTNCQLRNYKKVAEKIFNGGNKVVCAWVLCEEINIIDKDFIQYDINCDRIRYNPRVQPNWLLNEEIVDNHYFFGIGSVDSGLYLI